MYGTAFKIVRQYRRRTLQDLAAEIGFGYTWISQIENNHRAPSLALLEAYATYLGVRMSSFIAFAEALQEPNYQQQRMCNKMRTIYDWAVSD